jgi:hypothetical protein
MGALSLSEVNDNPLMWSHYSEGHTGFVLEFDDQHSYFTSPNGADEVLWTTNKILYAKERPQTTIIELDMRAILLTKHVSWAYEREWKHFRPLNQAGATIDAPPFAIHLMNFPADCLRSVTFGSRLAPAVRESVISAAKSKADLAHIRFLQAELDLTEYILHIRAVEDA